MSPASLRLAVAALLAAAAVFPFAVPEIGGIETWKVLLGILGLCLFIAGGRKRPDDGGGSGGAHS